MRLRLRRKAGAATRGPWQETVLRDPIVHPHPPEIGNKQDPAGRPHTPRALCHIKMLQDARHVAGASGQRGPFFPEGRMGPG